MPLSPNIFSQREIGFLKEKRRLNGEQVSRLLVSFNVIIHHITQYSCDDAGQTASCE